MPLNGDEKILFWDTETTGLRRAEFVQIGIVDADENVVVEALIQPTVPISAEAAAIHSFDKEKLTQLGAAPFDEAWAVILNALQEYRALHKAPTLLLAGFNSSKFDEPILRRLTQDIPDWLRFIDVRFQAVALLSTGMQNVYSRAWNLHAILSDFAPYAQLAEEWQHHAVGDAKAVRRLLMHCFLLLHTFPFELTMQAAPFGGYAPHERVWSVRKSSEQLLFQKHIENSHEFSEDIVSQVGEKQLVELGNLILQA